MWNNVERKLPVVEDDDEVGEIPYFVAYYPEDPSNRFDDDLMTNDDLFIGIGYYYGNNHWKNNSCRTLFVKYWMEIEELPND